MISILQPHEDHFGHVLASHDREHAEDHHFEPVNYRRDIIKAKHATRKNRRRRRRQLHNLMGTGSSASIDGSRADKAETQSLAETDDVPDVPMPVSEFPEDYEYKELDDEVAIPLEELAGRSSSSPQPHDSVDGGDTELGLPLSPHVIVQSRQTEV